MKISELRCDEETEAHIWSRHRVALEEVHEAAFNHGLAVRGRSKGVYEVYGCTDAGRYLMIALRDLGKGVLRLITAREMSPAERSRYGSYTAH